MTRPRSRFPFSAVVGHDDAKLALLMAALDARVGGVLLRGEKGSAKTTLARGLAGLVGTFCELPLGATEDRVIGTFDVAAALAGDGVVFRPGLLAQADGGVLYVDEVNLLADHLVDALLDAAVSGEQIVERDGISHRHPARFVLVASMNPEEGELRPQLLDRFGLCVDVRASRDVDERVEAVRRRLARDAADAVAAESSAAGSSAAESLVGGSRSGDPSGGVAVETFATASDDRFAAQDAALAQRLRDTTPAALDDEIIDAASRLALSVGAEGLRADLTLCRAAAAHAGLDGRDATTIDDLRAVAPLVLAHRARRNPYDPPVIPPDELAAAIDDTLGPPDPSGDRGDGSGDHGDGNGEGEEGGGSGAADPAADDGSHDTGERSPEESDNAEHAPADDAASPGDADSETDDASGDGSHRDPRPRGPAATERPLVVATTARRTSLPPLAPVMSERGRLVRSVPAADGAPVGALSSVRALATRRVTDPGASMRADDLRSDVHVERPTRLIVVTVDLSGSMGAPRRASMATETVLGLLDDVYQRRHRVALVAFRGEEAKVELAPTTSVDVARNRLHDLATGGATPLAAGLRCALSLVDRHPDDHPLIVVLTDGRATGHPGAFADALEVAGMIRHRGVDALVVDCEDGPVRLELATALADAMGAHLLPPDERLPAAVAAHES